MKNTTDTPADTSVKKPHIQLPIHDKVEEITALLADNQVIVIAGETGSGKTTQLPQICHALGYANKGLIAVTQPRRIAATSTAKRVAEEMDTPLGQRVGYKIRFAEKRSADTQVLFMTDGMLLSELSSDKMLKKYSVIIIDEAHERSLNIDFLLGYLRTLIKKRPDLKVIISSATIDTELFSKAFDTAPIVKVSGRMFPVEMIYDALGEDDKGNETYIEKACNSVDEIIGSDLEGDILIFMPTERDIMETVDKLVGRKIKNSLVLPLFARLTRFQQNRIFEPTSQRKIVVSTNIAETSLTINGIRFVIDTGLARVSRYAPNLRTNRLPVEEISQAEAQQRSGRAGRVAEGICIRLYDEKNYLARPEYRTPEIKRSNLAGVILSMLKMKLGSIEHFPFLEAPEKRAISDAFSQLFELGATTSKRVMTALGHSMARLPLEPHISRMILQANREGVVTEIAIIAAGLSIVDPRERPSDMAAEADEMHKMFIDHRSDFVTLLKLWESYHRTVLEQKTQRKMRKYCKEHFLNFNRMQEWGDVHRQIISILREKKIKSNSSFEGDSIKTSAIHRAICSGLVSSVALFDSEAKCYRATRNRLVHLFPGSVIAKKKNRPNWIMAQEIVETSRTWARGVGPIDPRWIEEFVPHLLKKTYGIPFYDIERGSVLVKERALFQGLEISNNRLRFYGKINSADAHDLFIRQALIEGKIVQKIPFLTHNIALQEGLEQDEAKLRIKGSRLSDDEFVALYKERIGSPVASVKELLGWIKKQGSDKSLCFTKKELLTQSLSASSQHFPKSMAVGSKSFPLNYTYSPGGEEDGVTVTIPLGEVAFVRDTTFGWLVKPLWGEKVAALLKTLPKIERKKFAPIAESAKEIAESMSFGAYPFIEEMVRAIAEVSGNSYKSNLFNESTLPDHLKMRIAVTDRKGKVISTTRNTEELQGINQKQSEKRAPSEIASLLLRAEVGAITSWSFGDLAPQKEITKGKGGFTLFGYPALCKKSDGSIALTYEASPQQAEKTHSSGVVALLSKLLVREFDWLRKDLKFSQKLSLLSAPFGGAKKLQERLYELISESVLAPPERYILLQSDFDALLKERTALLKGAGFRALTHMEKVLVNGSDNREKLAKYRQKYSAGSYATLVSELEGELELYFEQFLEGYFPYALFLRFDAITAAFGYRIDKAFLSTVQYRKGEELLLLHQNRVADLVENAHRMSQAQENILIGYICLVEEYGIQLFAHPHVKPSDPVSEKRLAKVVAPLLDE